MMDNFILQKRLNVKSTIENLDQESNYKRKRGSTSSILQQVPMVIGIFQHILEEDLPLYIIQWLMGNKDMFYLLLKMVGEVEFDIVANVRMQLFTCYDWLRRESRYLQYFEQHMWIQLETIMNNRLKSEKFLDPQLSSLIQKFRISPKEFCQKRISFIAKKPWNVITFPRDNKVKVDGVKGTSLRSISNMEYTRASLPLLDNEWSTIDKSFHQVPCETGIYYFVEETPFPQMLIGGLAKRKVSLHQMERVRELLITFYKIKGVLKRGTRKNDIYQTMRAAGSKVCNRWCGKYDIPKNTLQWYVDKEKVCEKFDGIDYDHQIVFEKYLHNVLVETVIALGLQYFPTVISSFLKVSLPYLYMTEEDEMVFDQPLRCSKHRRGPTAWPIFFTRNYNNRLHVDHDASVWTLMIVSNPKNKHGEGRFCIRSHKVLVELSHGDIIIFRGDLLHGTEFRRTEEAMDEENDILVLAIAINQQTGIALKKYFQV